MLFWNKADMLKTQVMTDKFMMYEHVDADMYTIFSFTRNTCINQALEHS